MSGIITTVAGNGARGFSGDGGAATSAQLSYPSVLPLTGQATSSSRTNNRIRRVSTSGIITTVAGNGAAGFSGDGGAAGTAQLFASDGVAVDGSGNLFISDTHNSRIRKVSTNGIITTVAGNGTLGFSGDGGAATSAQLGYPSGVAVDGSGNLFIADVRNDRIRKVSTGGIITTVAGNGHWVFRGTAGRHERPTGRSVQCCG